MLIAAQPTRGLDVGAIEFVHRRLVEERDEGRGILLVSLELEEILSLSDRILVMYEGEIVGEYPPTTSEEELGIAMTGGGRRTRGGGVSENAQRRAVPTGAPPDPSGLGPEVKQSVLGRYDVAQKAGGLLAPVLTALLAFFVGGLVVLVTTGSNPITTYRAIFDGAGLQLALPVDHRRRHARIAAAQPPADADPHDDVDPHRPRRRIRVPLRALQHRRQGPVHRRRRSLARLDRLVVQRR